MIVNSFTEASVIYNYIHGGKGTVTLMAPSGNSHTYLFAKPADRDAFPDDVIFVYVIHEDKRFYIGMMERDRFRLTRNSRFNRDCESVKGAYYIVAMSLDQSKVNRTPMKLFHNGHCAVCGRSLSSKKAMYTGIGRSCMKRCGK